MPTRQARREELDGGFAISTYDERQIESNAEERFSPRYGDADDRAKALKAKLIDSKGKITAHGWEVLNKDVLLLEHNSMAWLKKTFVSARDEGHDSHGDLAGTFFFDPSNENQVRLVEMGENERIDMTDGSYGDLSHTVFKGVSSFGEALLGGRITFYDVKKSAHADFVRPRRRSGLRR